MAEAVDLHLMDFETRSVPLVFQENRRARRIILRLDYGASRIVVVLPKRTTRHEGKRFALQNREWIQERLDQLPETVPFANGKVIPFLGTPHRIRHRATARGVVWVEGDEINVAGHEEHVSRRVADWLKLEARREIEARARAKAEQIGKTVKRVILRDTKSRWGSCHVMDYVVAHEVAHLREMNHGPRFWKLTGEICRGIDGARAWLEENGTDLYRYGR
jgi:predicted metal-dependent hydrolase